MSAPLRPLSELVRNRKSPEELLGGLLNESEMSSQTAGARLIANAKSYGLGMRDYLKLAIDPKKSEKKDEYRDDNGKFVGGYEASKLFLGLPHADDYDGGVVLEAASDTFAQFPGSRAMFPEVIDDLVQWQYRQRFFESVDQLVGGSRTVSGTVLLTTVIADTQSDYQIAQTLAEESRIAVKSIRDTQHSVQFFKFGYGYRLTYEFQRRARIDTLGPYLIRSERELEYSKVATATYMLLNGDAVQPAVSVVTQGSKDANATAGTISRKGILAWLTDRSKLGVPVDILVGNWDAYLAWQEFGLLPVTTATVTDKDLLQRQGVRVNVPNLITDGIQFALSSTMPAGQLLGYSKADTMEQLVEAGSQISESERSVMNQVVNYTKTENSGYRLVFGDTRSVYDFGN